MAAKKPTKKTTSTGSPTLDAANAAKKFKAPKDYKPLTTAQKVAMVASVVGPGKVVKGAKAIKDEIVMAKAGWNAAAKANYRASVKRGTYADARRVANNKAVGIASARQTSAKLGESLGAPAKDIKVVQKSITKRGGIGPINKVTSKAEARALKAANKPTRASKNPDTAAVKRIAEANRGLGQKEPYATRNAQERVDILNAHFGKAKGYKGNSTPPKKAIIKKKSK